MCAIDVQNKSLTHTNWCCSTKHKEINNNGSIAINQHKKVLHFCLTIKTTHAVMIILILTCRIPILVL